MQNCLIARNVLKPGKDLKIAPEFLSAFNICITREQSDVVPMQTHV